MRCSSRCQGIRESSCSRKTSRRVLRFLFLYSSSAKVGWFKADRSIATRSPHRVHFSFPTMPQFPHFFRVSLDGWPVAPGFLGLQGTRCGVARMPGLLPGADETARSSWPVVRRRSEGLLKTHRSMI